MSLAPEPLATAPALVVGIGCRRGVQASRIEAAVRRALGPRPWASLAAVASAEFKCEEAGLRAFCRAHALPLHAVPAAHLRIAPSGDTIVAARTATLIGPAGLCEPCALYVAGATHLLVPRVVLDGVTVALAILSSLTGDRV